MAQIPYSYQEFTAANRKAAAFTALLGLNPQFLRNWRSELQIGILDPNNDRDRLYSLEDALKLHIAQSLIAKVPQLTWPVAFPVGRAVGDLLTDRALRPHDPANAAKYFAFAPGVSEHVGAGLTADDAMRAVFPAEVFSVAAPAKTAAPTVFHVFSVDAIDYDLPDFLAIPLERISEEVAKAKGRA